MSKDTPFLLTCRVSKISFAAAKLTDDDLARLDEEARKHINRKIGLSTERQLEVNKEDILKQWFAQQKET